MKTFFCLYILSCFLFSPMIHTANATSEGTSYSSSETKQNNKEKSKSSKKSKSYSGSLRDKAYSSSDNQKNYEEVSSESEDNSSEADSFYRKHKERASTILPKTKVDNTQVLNVDALDLDVGEAKDDDENFSFVKNSSGDVFWMKVWGIILLILAFIGFSYLLVGILFREHCKKKRKFKKK